MYCSPSVCSSGYSSAQLAGVKEKSPSGSHRGSAASELESEASILSKDDALKPPPIDNSALCVQEPAGTKKLPSLTNEGTLALCPSPSPLCYKLVKLARGFFLLSLKSPILVLRCDYIMCVCRWKVSDQQTTCGGKGLHPSS